MSGELNNSNWQTVKLGDVCTKIGSGATPRGGKESYKDSGIALFRSQNILDFNFSSDGLAFIDEQQAAKLSNVEVQLYDVLINITGDSVARVCIAPEEYLPARVNQHVAIIRTNHHKANAHYIFYYLQYIKEYLLSLSSAGATRNALTKIMLEELEIMLPTIKEQQIIADTLSVLDARIAENKKINHHLAVRSATDSSPYMSLGKSVSRTCRNRRFSRLFCSNCA